MKTKEMRRIIEESFCCEIAIDYEQGLDGDISVVAMLIDNCGNSIGSNSVFRGFLTGYGTNETKAIRNLYTTIRSVTWKGVKQIGHERA